MKTSEANGLALDFLVTTAENKLPQDLEQWIEERATGTGWPWTYCTDCSQGGPIIEREGMDLFAGVPEWMARIGDHEYCGPTPLIAAMRCYVASKLGDEVDVPEELLPLGAAPKAPSAPAPWTGEDQEVSEPKAPAP